MNYLIVSTDKITLDEKIKELNKNNDSEIVYYDLQDTNISRLIEDLNTYNLLSSKKIIIGLNSYLLSTEKVKTNVDEDLSILEQYLNNPNPDNTLILVTPSLDKRKKAVTEILKKVQLIDTDLDITSIIKKRLDDYKIDSKCVNRLIEKCSNDHERILNEIEKLKLYKLNEKEITISDIEEVVIDNYDDNIFHFVDSIITGDKKKAFKLYNDFILHGEQIPFMIAILSNKIRLYYQVAILSDDNHNYKDIAKMLNMHEYPIKLAFEQLYRYNISKLKDLLYKLAKLDYEIKSGDTTGEVEFETLLASI